MTGVLDEIVTHLLPDFPYHGTRSKPSAPCTSPRVFTQCVGTLCDWLLKSALQLIVASCGLLSFAIIVFPISLPGSAMFRQWLKEIAPVTWTIFAKQKPIHEQPLSARDCSLWSKRGSGYENRFGSNNGRILQCAPCCITRKAAGQGCASRSDYNGR